jgi:uncharacterized repeat protein (TIGR03837 family)
MGLQWDLFCRVVDNFGDIGVCWRLAADLASRGETVRLWIDDASALAWMAPAGAERVTVLPWCDDGAATEYPIEPGDVVIEAFGCNPPDKFVAAMAAQPVPPVWINLEYLSAEGYVERSHRLLSVHTSGLKKWFFYPGFTPRTGGLVREGDLLARQQRFDGVEWLRSIGAVRRGDEQVISLFCYDNPALPELLDRLSQRPTLLLTTAGLPTAHVARALGPKLQRGALRCIALPSLTQRDYDHLLWSCDLNFVRGEDSFVRAQWAGRSFVWQIYPQADAAHATKLDAFLQLHLAGAEAPLAADIRTLWTRWNGLSAALLRLPDDRAWHQHTLAWCKSLLIQADLASQLTSFARETR